MNCKGEKRNRKIKFIDEIAICYCGRYINNESYGFDLGKRENPGFMKYKFAYVRHSEGDSEKLVCCVEDVGLLSLVTRRFARMHCQI